MAIPLASIPVAIGALTAAVQLAGQIGDIVRRWQDGQEPTEEEHAALDRAMALSDGRLDDAVAKARDRVRKKKATAGK